MRLSRQFRVTMSILALCVAAYYLPAGVALAGLPPEQVIAAAGAGAMVLAAAAAGLAFLAWRRTAATERRLLHFAQLVEGSLSDAVLRDQRHRADLGIVQDRLLQKASTEAAAEKKVAPVPERPPLVAANDQRAGGPVPVSLRLDDEALVRLAGPLRRAAAGDLAISLQSILPARGTPPLAYEVHLRLQLSATESHDFRRLPADLAGIEPASFERLLFVRAAEAARAMSASRNPSRLHVPVSEALLCSGPEFAAVLGMLTDDPWLAEALVVSLPAACLAADAGHSQALELMAQAGVQFACEGAAPAEMADAIRAAVAWVKLPAETLLSQPSSFGTGTAGVLVATAVESESEVARLAALGVPLVTGHAVSGPCLAAMPNRDRAPRKVNRF